MAQRIVCTQALWRPTTVLAFLLAIGVASAPSPRVVSLVAARFGDEPGCPKLAPDQDTVIHRFTLVTYCKASFAKIELQWEFIGSEKRLYVPNDERWRREMPAWSVERKHEVVPRLLALSERDGIKYIVKEY